jgi:DnaK suppressor protein
MEAGTYGLCIDCGTHIPAARLQVAPEAARCIPCQEKVE